MDRISEWRTEGCRGATVSQSVSHAEWCGPHGRGQNACVNRGFCNLRNVRTVGDRINRRMLETERLGHDCGLAPALKFGPPRVTALLNALCHFLWIADGLTNAQRRPLVASLLGTPYTTRQMRYDLRRLLLKGMLTRLDHKNRYVLTPCGRRVALFLTRSTPASSDRVCKRSTSVSSPKRHPACAPAPSPLTARLMRISLRRTLPRNHFPAVSHTFWSCKHC
jgi:hypothetical protein